MTPGSHAKLDEQAANEIRTRCWSGDIEGDHSHADNVLLSLLAQLGFIETVRAWLAVHKWYA